jgi:hypothetical protein
VPLFCRSVLRTLLVEATERGGDAGVPRLSGMGKRSRRRAVEGPKRAGSVWQTARVRVDDETWAEFRRSLGDQSVAEALGAHVEREVAAWRRRRATSAELDEHEVVEMLERVEAATATLEALARRLEFRLPVQRPD